MWHPYTRVYPTFASTPVDSGSIPNSSDGSGVSPPTLCAATWSIEGPWMLMSTPSVLVIVVHVSRLDSFV